MTNIKRSTLTLSGIVGIVANALAYVFDAPVELFATEAIIAAGSATMYAASRVGEFSLDDATHYVGTKLNAVWPGGSSVDDIVNPNPADNPSQYQSPQNSAEAKTPASLDAANHSVSPSGIRIMESVKVKAKPYQMDDHDPNVRVKRTSPDEERVYMNIDEVGIGAEEKNVPDSKSEVRIKGDTTYELPVENPLDGAGYENDNGIRVLPGYQTKNGPVDLSTHDPSIRLSSGSIVGKRYAEDYEKLSSAGEKEKVSVNFTLEEMGLAVSKRMAYGKNHKLNDLDLIVDGTHLGDLLDLYESRHKLGLLKEPDLTVYNAKSSFQDE